MDLLGRITRRTALLTAAALAFASNAAMAETKIPSRWTGNSKGLLLLTLQPLTMATFLLQGLMLKFRRKRITGCDTQSRNWVFSARFC